MKEKAEDVLFKMKILEIIGKCEPEKIKETKK